MFAAHKHAGRHTYNQTRGVLRLTTKQPSIGQSGTPRQVPESGACKSTFTPTISVEALSARTLTFAFQSPAATNAFTAPCRNVLPNCLNTLRPISPSATVFAFRFL